MRTGMSMRTPCTIARRVYPSVFRRAILRLWGHLPGWAQRLAVRVTVRKVTLGVCAVVQDTHGRILLVRHPYRRGAWGLPGGFSRGEEQPTDTLVRELWEELGVAATIGQPISVEIAAPGGHLTVYYRATLAGTPQPDGVEIAAAHYVSPAEVPALLGESAPPWLRQVWSGSTPGAGARAA